MATLVKKYFFRVAAILGTGEDGGGLTDSNNNRKTFIFQHSLKWKGVVN